MLEKKYTQKEIFSKNFQKWLKIRGKSQSDIVEAFDISPSTVSDWFNGKKYPRIDKIELIADFLNIYKSDLIEEHGRTDKMGNPVISIPLLGTVKAGYDYLAEENWIGTVDISEKLAKIGTFFALRVKGESMSPAIMENDIVIIQKQDDCENNDIAIVRVNGEEGTIKKIKKTDAGITLQPLNPNYDPLFYTNEEIKSVPIVIVGIVKELKREF